MKAIKYTISVESDIRYTNSQTFERLPNKSKPNNTTKFHIIGQYLNVQLNEVCIVIKQPKPYLNQSYAKLHKMEQDVLWNYKKHKKVEWYTYSHLTSC